jgi:hypothetical protein
MAPESWFWFKERKRRPGEPTFGCILPRLEGMVPVKALP